jgi:hypothetical protein
MEAATMRGTMLVVVWLLGSVGGCGPGVAEESSGPPTSRYGPETAAVTTRASAETEVRQTMRPTVAPTPNPDQTLTVPDWMERDLRHPDATVRLEALDTWMEQGRSQGMGPVLAALTDPDERVRDRALQLIEQDWAVEQEMNESGRASCE